MSSEELGFAASDEDIQSEIELYFEEKKKVSLEPIDADQSVKKRKATEYDVVEATKGKKIKTKHKKHPTADELNRLRDTESLFHSNIFRLQIEELLSEMKVKEKYQSLIEKWIQSFKGLVENLPESGPHKMEEIEYLRELNVACPLLESRPDKKTQFRFISPKKVSIIGSHLIKAATKPVINVDIGIEIPERCFRDKDAHDYRYFRKRALYMAYLAGHLKSSEMQPGLKYCTSDNPFLPVLEVTPVGKLEKSVKFILRPYGNPACFKVAKFFPSMNNIRASWISNGDETTNLPTPKYNAAMLREILLEENEKKRHEVFEKMPAASHAFILLKVWLHQRNLDEGFGAFTPFVMSMYMVYLAQQKKINTFMSAYQLLRNVLLHLGEADLSRPGITLCKVQGKEGTPTLIDFASNYEVIFVDDSGFLNICASVSLLTWNRVKWEASLSLKILESSSGRKSFDELFMTPKDFLSSMDHIVRIDEAELEAAFKSKHIIQSLKSPKLSLLDSGMSVPMTILPSIFDLLQQGLKGRTSLITLESHHGTKSEVDLELKSYGGISIGFVIDPEKDWNPLIKGPEADQIEEAKKFHSFWGEKAQLRRFQDGTICEAVVFPATNLYERRLITKQIVGYIFERHLNIKNLTYVADQLECILKKPMVENYGSGEEANAAVMKAMKSLGKQLRDLRDAPLTVTSIQGTSSAFRCTDVFPPIPGLAQGDNNCLKKKGPVTIPVFTRSIMPTYFAPMEVILTLETSNKWPDDLNALRRLKAAFYIAICKELSSKYGLIAYPTPTFVDVLKDGFVFRLRIAYPREVHLARTFKDTDGVLKQRDTELSIQLEKDTVILPMLSAALYGLQSLYPSFGTAARLAKRWIAGHMLSLQMPELVTELLVASIYLDSPPGSFGPISPQIGFLQFLRKVARTDWNAVPLVLNFNNLLRVEEIAEVESQFSSQRSTLPPLVLYTSYTKNPKLLTADGPTLPVLARVMLLASETLKLLEDSLSRFKPNISDYKMLFRPATTVFDAVIRLNPKMVAKRHMNLDAKTLGPPAKILPLEKIDTIPLVGFEPALLYLEELKECYGEIARFFYDSYGGFAIGVFWDKNALEDSDFKVSSVKARKLNQKGRLSINFGAIIQDFSVIGKDLVDRIEINFEKWISPDKE